MSAAANDQRKLERIIEYAARISECIDGYNITREEFVNPVGLDQRTRQSSIDNYMTRLLEEAWDITDETREHMPDEDWGAISHMRNVFTHSYDSVNADIVWDAIENEIPSLVDSCKACLSEIESGSYTPAHVSRSAERQATGNELSVPLDANNPE